MTQNNRFSNISASEILMATALDELRDTNKVCERYDVKKPTLLTTLRRLEEKVGARLFDVYKNGQVDVIEDNRHILENIKDLSEHFDRFYGNLGFHYKTEINGNIHLSTTQTLLEAFFLPHFDTIIRRHPELNFFISQTESMDNPNQGFDEILFCGMREEDMEDKRYVYFPFHCFQQRLWASKKFLARYGPIHTLEDLEGSTMLLFSKRSFRHLPGITQTNPELFETFTVVNVHGARAIDVLAEEGVGFMRASRETVALCDLKVQPIVPSYDAGDIDLYARVRREFMYTNKAAIMLNWIFECRDKQLAKINMKPNCPYVPL